MQKDRTSVNRRMQMKLQLINIDAAIPSTLLIDSMEVTATGVGIEIGNKTYLIGCAYISSLNVIWQDGTIWLGINSPESLKRIFEEIFDIKSHQFA
jgi:hypothetical protein